MERLVFFLSLSCAVMMVTAAAATATPSSRPTRAPSRTPSRRPTTSPTVYNPASLLGYHGGGVMVSLTTYALFWGSSWGTSPGDKITGMDTFYSGYGGSAYAAAVDEYTGTNGQVTPVSVHKGHFIDTSPAPPQPSAADVVREVCKVIAAHGLAVDATTYIGVYVDQPRCTVGTGTATATGVCANYCGYHTGGTCTSGTTGVVFQFAFYWNMDGDPACDPQDNPGVTGHSQGLAAIANMSGHELSEVRTNPGSFGAGAWYNTQGKDEVEVGDLCAWTYPVPYVTFADGTRWKQPAVWSNKSYMQTGNGCVTAAPA